MKASDFRVTSIRMSSVNFELCNNNYDGNIEYDFNSKYSIAEDGKNIGRLEMEIRVFPTIEKPPFRINTKMEGMFEWSEGIKKDELEMYLSVNGNAVLYSYARPILTQLTTFAGCNPLFMPLMNFVDDEE